MPLYLKTQYPITGRVTAVGYSGWTFLHAFQWGASRPVSVSPTTEVGRSNMSAVTLSKEIDVVTPYFGREFNIARGLNYQIVQTLGASVPYEAFRCDIFNAVVEGQTFSVDGAANAETVTLVFERHRSTVRGEDAKGGGGPPVSWAFDQNA